MKNSSSGLKANPFTPGKRSKIVMHELAKRSKAISHEEAMHRMKEAVAEQKKQK